MSPLHNPLVRHFDPGSCGDPYIFVLKPNKSGIPEILILRILMFLWPCGPLVTGPLNQASRVQDKICLNYVYN